MSAPSFILRSFGRIVYHSANEGGYLPSPTTFAVVPTDHKNVDRFSHVVLRPSVNSRSFRNASLVIRTMYSGLTFIQQFSLPPRMYFEFGVLMTSPSPLVWRSERLLLPNTTTQPPTLIPQSRSIASQRLEPSSLVEILQTRTDQVSHRTMAGQCQKG